MFCGLPMEFSAKIEVKGVGFCGNLFLFSSTTTYKQYPHLFSGTELLILQQNERVRCSVLLVYRENKTQYVTEVAYYVRDSYADGLFQSCKNVS